MDDPRQPTNAAFSIATPAVTTILPMTENMSDTSFMLTATSYQQGMLAEESLIKEDTDKSNHMPPSTSSLPTSSQRNDGTINSDLKEVDEHGCSSESVSNPSQQINSYPTASSQDDGSKMRKKKLKVTKKGTKLDAKSKLEKSRQSARECRARKKLRYQYLEDLVSNREKAVSKLREELSMFCDLSKQIDVGIISESDRRLLVDQTKENSNGD